MQAEKQLKNSVMLKSNVKLPFSILICSLLILSCGRNQDEDVELDIDTEVALVEVQIEKTFTSIDDIADQAELGTTVTKKTYSENDILKECAVVTKDTASGSSKDTVNIVVDFGTVDCEGDDGVTRKGKIIITSIIDKLTTVRLERKIETENYVVDGNIIDITRKLDYGGQDQQNNHYWNLDMNGRIDFKDGRYITRNIDQVRTWVEGTTTLADWTDDAFTIQGTSTGKRIDEKELTATISETLKVRTSCSYVVSGKVKIETSGRPDLLVDYGNGTCDNKAECTSLGKTWTITL